jgi:threonine dehydratase
MLTLADIEAARTRIAGVVRRSPCSYSRALSARVGAELHLKLENLQSTGSFKERGACNKLVQLGADAGQVFCASAGNHAQGVAYHAQRLGLRATIVMPVGAPLVKLSTTRELGAEVVLHGGNYDEAFAEARRLHAERGGTFIHGFDDRDVMAGQGTVGLELLEQLPGLDAVVVPVGGGGLLGGIAVAIKERAPHVRVIGVQSAALPSMVAALAAGRPVEVESRRTLADGIGVRRVGAQCLAICQRYVDELVTVDEDSIAEAVLALLEREKTLAEGAGAAALAGLLSGALPSLAGKCVAVLVSGGNIDVNVMARVVDRGLWRQGRLVRLRCIIQDKPGALASLVAVLAAEQANVLDVEHERVDDDVELGQTAVEILLEATGFAHVERLERALSAHGIVSERDLHLRRTARRSLKPELA